MVMVASITGVMVIKNAARPPKGAGEAEIIISPGMTLTQTAKALKKAGVIRNATYFVWLAGRKGLAGKIRAGEYRVKTGIYPGEVLDQLVKGKVLFRRVTVPEGKTLAEISLIIEKAGIGSADEFRRAAWETSGSEPWIAPGAENLEGVLFPETYSYSSDDSAADLVKMMTDRFKKAVGPIWEQRPKETTLDPHETLILAAIVEKETAKAEERTLIAGVFINRLKINMLLQSDPTVIYGIPNFDGNLTRAHLNTPTPYNTYTNEGLPAGPICNPGAEAIKAVLHPAETDKLYFVSKGDGSHYFSATLAEHNDAVRRYQKGKTAKNGGE